MTPKLSPDARKRTYQIVAGVVAVLTVFGVAADGLDPEQIVDTIEGAVVVLTALMAQRHVTKPD